MFNAFLEKENIADYDFLCEFKFRMHIVLGCSSRIRLENRRGVADCSEYRRRKRNKTFNRKDR